MDIVDIIFQSYSNEELDKNIILKEIDDITKLERTLLKTLSKSQKDIYFQLESMKFDEEMERQKAIIKYVISFYKTILTGENK